MSTAPGLRALLVLLCSLGSVAQAEPTPAGAAVSAAPVGDVGPSPAKQSLTARPPAPKLHAALPAPVAEAAPAEPSGGSESALPKPSAPAEARGYLRPAKAAESAGPVAQKSDPELGRILLAVLLLAAIGAVALWARSRRRGLPLIRQQVRLHTVASLTLGPKQSVALVSVGNEALLLGVTEHGITALRTFAASELGALTAQTQNRQEREPEDDEQSDARPQAASKVFNDLLVQASRFQVQKAAPRPGQPTTARRGSAEVTSLSARAARQAIPQRQAEHDEDEDQLPPHLAEVLGELQSPAKPAQHAPRSTGGRRDESRFDESDGQAQELVRRFHGLNA